MDTASPRGVSSRVGWDLMGGSLQVGAIGSGARSMAVFPLFNGGSELYWDTTGSASSFMLSLGCQDLQALAVGQRGPPSLTRLGEPQESDTLRHHFQELHPLPQEA